MSVLSVVILLFICVNSIGLKKTTEKLSILFSYLNILYTIILGLTRSFILSCTQSQSESQA
jgi:hypothetical protein